MCLCNSLRNKRSTTSHLVIFFETDEDLSGLFFSGFGVFLMIYMFIGFVTTHFITEPILVERLAGLL